MFGFGKTKHGKPALPTVRFDPKQITEAVRADLWARINEFEDLPCGQEKAIYQAALATVTKGFALDVLAQALIDMGVSKGRASEVTRYLANRASAIMNVERLVKLGSTKAKWGIPARLAMRRGRLLPYSFTWMQHTRRRAGNCTQYQMGC